jgi:hypothetical protein
MAATATLAVATIARRAGKSFLTDDTLRKAPGQSITVRRGVYFYQQIARQKLERAERTDELH